MKLFLTLLVLWWLFALAYTIYQWYRNDAAYRIIRKYEHKNSPETIGFMYEYIFEPKASNWYGLKFPNKNDLKINERMKKLILIIAIALSANCMSQTRFEKEYYCDTCFLNAARKELADFATFNQAIKEIQADTNKITITKEECLLLYLTGYINGSLNFKSKGCFDFDSLIKEIRLNKKIIDRRSRLKL